MNKITKKYFFNGKAYDTYIEAQKEALRLDYKFAIKDIINRHLWNLCYDIDTKYETTEDCHKDEEYTYNIDAILNAIINELEYEENRENLKKFIYGAI